MGKICLGPFFHRCKRLYTLRAISVASGQVIVTVSLYLVCTYLFFLPITKIGDFKLSRASNDGNFNNRRTVLQHKQRIHTCSTPEFTLVPIISLGLNTPGCRRGVVASAFTVIRIPDLTVPSGAMLVPLTSKLNFASLIALYIYNFLQLQEGQHGIYFHHISDMHSQAVSMRFFKQLRSFVTVRSFVTDMNVNRGCVG